MKVIILSNIQIKNFIVKSTVRLVLCFYILFPLLSFAGFSYSLDNIEPTIVENPTQIFVSSQTVIVGLEDIHNADVVNEITKEKDLPLAKNGDKKNLPKKTASAVVLKKDLEKIQKKNEVPELKTKEYCGITSSHDTNTNFVQKYGKVCNALVSSQNSSKQALFFCRESKALPYFEGATEKTKILYFLILFTIW